MKKIGIICICVAFLNACTTSEHEVKQIDTELEHQANVDGKEIGINDDDEVVLQEKVSAAEELRKLTWANNRNYEKLEDEHHLLGRCREDLSDPRLGGDGNPQDLPEIENLKSKPMTKEEFGADEKDELKFVKKEFFMDRIKAERKSEKALKSTYKIVRKQKHECDRKMGYARSKHGLPSKRYAAKGYFQSNGTWIQTRKAEVTLDDAFEIRAIDSSGTKK